MKAKKQHPSELTDRIKVFRKAFERHEHGTVHINTQGMEVVMRELREIEALAVEFRHELSALRWNAEGRQDERDMTEEAVLAALKDPASNVRVLPVRERPFADGNRAS